MFLYISDSKSNGDSMKLEDFWQVFESGAAQSTMKLCLNSVESWISC